jgi:photosynthetic reaction center cytochrome c subunit
MEQVYNPRTLARRSRSLQPAAESRAGAPPDGPKAKDSLPERAGAGRPERGASSPPHGGHHGLGVARRRAATTATTGENFADDSKYTKVVARRMLQMTQHINAELEEPRRRRPASPATPATAATRCRPTSGSPEPEKAGQAVAWLGNKAARTRRAASVALLAAVRPVHALPARRRSADPRVTGTTALPTGNRQHDSRPRHLRPDDAHVEARWA